MITLEKGVSIIEASAGTGKTYTLCRIVLQLIVEKGIPIDRILAITFTQAATEELITRIRELLHKAVIEIASGQIKEKTLIELLKTEGIDSHIASKRLRHSLEVFDDASISTIHGFCKRSLEFVSLESDIAFEANLEPVDDELVKRLQDEYVRINVLERSPLLAAFYTQTATYKKRLVTIAKECASHPYANLEPQPPQADMERVDRAFQDILNSIEPLLASAESILPHLKKNGKFAKRISSETKRNELESLSQRQFPLLSDLSLLKDFTPKTWNSALKKSGEGIEEPAIAEAVDSFLQEIDALFSVIIANYRSWLFDNLRAEKERRNIISFNDLLHILNRALNDEQGDSVVQAINEQFDAALIDEFQDTDPTQYNIVNRLFGDGSKYLFFIGDPKQAIYRFRGADIYSYFNATDTNVAQRIQLSKNFRSTPMLIQAVNTLFSASPDGFAFDKIQFSPANANRPADGARPLQIEAIGLNEPATLNQSVLVELLATAAAEDLAQRALANADFDLGKVAFLVGTNQQADMLVDCLAQRGIDCVLRAERSVFQTAEMDSLLQLLETLSNPSKQRIVRALLLTPIGGYNWSDLLDREFEEKSQEIVAFLHDWSRNWRASHFDASFHRFLKMTGATKRLLGKLGGERQYANLTQLSELLQSEALTRLSTPKHLYAWLHSKREENVSTQEDWQTRLTSDEGKPQIVTIHKSKGLQFPIVICPFLTLLQPKAKRDHALYHRSDQQSQLVIDLSPENNPDALQRAETEEYAEQLRLIYVALTRAEDECHVYLGPEESGPRQNPRPSTFCQLILGSEEAIRLHSQKAISPTLLARIQEINSDCIVTTSRPLPEPDSQTKTLVPRSYDKGFTAKPRLLSRGFIPTSERILSFSTITRIVQSKESILEEIENDEFEVAPDPLLAIEDAEPETDGPNIFNLPKGAHTGNLIHSILEELDFQEPDSISELVTQSFTRLRYGYPEYRRVAVQLVNDLISKALTGGFALNQISPENRVPEMEFAYPTSADTLRKIHKAFQNHPSPGIPKAWIDGLALNQAHVRPSMLRGYIDLVFEHNNQLFILDWKTNHLGNRTESYQNDILVKNMSEHDYYLQYCLYSVALKRYLKIRSPQVDFYEAFGGVYYLFVRGISEQDDSGIFFDRPSRELLNALDQAIER